MVNVSAEPGARCMKLKTRLLFATTFTVLVILGASEWLNYVSVVSFLNGHEVAMERVRDQTSLVTGLERSKHDLVRKLVLLHLAHACLTVLGLIGILHILWWRMFLRPLERLLQHVHAMGLGTWTDPIRVERPDEIGDLITAFNALGDQIAASVQQVSATSRLSAMALLGNRIVRKTAVVRDHVRAIQLMLEAARQEGGTIPEPAMANLTTIAGDLDEIASQFEAEFAHEFESHSVPASWPRSTQCAGALRSSVAVPTIGPLFPPALPTDCSASLRLRARRQCSPPDVSVEDVARI